MKKHIALTISLILTAASLLTSCSQPKRYQSSFFSLFDTVTFIVGYSKTETEFKQLSSEIETQIREYHQLYDIYNDYDGINNIKTINDNAGIEPIKVDQRIIDLLKLGKKMHNETNGLTNIAMGSVLRIWHDYRTEATNDPAQAQVPKLEDLKLASLHMNIESLIIDEKNSTVFLKDPEMSLDVGSLGKGYAVEQVCRNLEKQGVDNLLLNVGGNIRAIGKKTNGDFWEVGVENPYGEETFMGIVLMDNNTLVTSGNYQRYYIVDGKKYHHIINPNTLMPENYITSVAVLCSDSGLADAYSTALFNMTPEEGLKWVENRADIEAMWMLNDKQVQYSDGFEAYLK